jgi:stress-induced morphogen
MPITKVELESLLKENLPGARFEIIDLAGDGDHYELRITSPEFHKKSKVEQHRMVYDALKGKMDKELHALVIKTKAE